MVSPKQLAPCDHDECGLTKCRLNDERFNPDESDRNFLMWIHQRLEHFYGDKPLYDHMRKLRAIIAGLDGDQNTNASLGQNGLESLKKSILSKESDNEYSFKHRA